MKDLFTHCGAVKMTRNEVDALPLPAPMGSRHVIRPLTEDVDLIEKEINSLGLEIVDSGYAVKFNDSKYFHDPSKPPKVSQIFGLFEIGNQRKDFSVMIGLRGSYDQSLPRGIAVGSRVFVCDNLAFSGAIHMHTKQTTNIDYRVKTFIQNAMETLPDFIKTQDSIFYIFKKFPITHEKGENIILDMFRNDIISSRGLVKVIEEWDEPKYDHGEDSIWTLFNAVTETYKDEENFRLNHIWQDSIKLTEFLKDYAYANMP